MFDIERGKDEATLVHNTRSRLSNSTTVELSEGQAAEVLHAVRETYQQSRP